MDQDGFLIWILVILGFARLFIGLIHHALQSLKEKREL